MLKKFLPLFVLMAICAQSLLSNSTIFSPISAKAAGLNPGGVAGSKLWLDASSGVTNTGTGTTATAWTDKSGTANNGTVSAGTPTYKNTSADLYNFNPVITFNGGAIKTTTLGPLGTGHSYTKYVVFKPNSTAIGNMVSTSGNNEHAFLHSAQMSLWHAGTFVTVGTAGTIATGGHYLSDGRYTGLGAADPNTIRVNGIINGTSNTVLSYNDTGAIQIGGNATPPNTFDNDDIAEVVVFPTAVTNVENIKIESYLAAKYGITLDQTTPLNYFATDATPYWTAATNTVYNKNITVIGRDDDTGLNQKQSKSVNTNALVTVGRGSIDGSNALNTNTFAVDKSYFAFGDDNGSLTWTTTGVPAGKQLLTRKFKTQTTNFAQSVKITVPDDSSTLAIKLPTEINNTVYLMVDNDGDGNFTTGTQQEIPMTYNAATKEWDPAATIPSGAVFTFGTPAPVNVTVNQAVGQPDPSPVGSTIKFTAMFDQDINPSTFTPSDVTGGGTATSCGITSVNPKPTGQNKIFEISVDCLSVAINSTTTVTILSNAVQTLAGVNNLAATSTDNTINIKVVPVCTAVPNPSNGSVLVVVTCTGVTLGDSTSIPGMTCTPNPATASGNVVCTENSLGSLISNPTATFTDGSGNAITAPVAYTQVFNVVNDTQTTPSGSPLTYNPLANDTVPAGSTISAINGTPVVVGIPISVTGGTITVNSNGTITVTPNAGYTGTLNFSYQVTAPNGTKVSANGSVSVTTVALTPATTISNLIRTGGFSENSFVYIAILMIVSGISLGFVAKKKFKMR
jgi:hypothetical protein